MSLFKIYSGTADEFPQDYALHPGYAYFFEDSGELVIDTENGRIDVKASSLIKDGGTEIEFIDVDDVLLSGTEGIAKNAILIGGDNNIIKAVSIENGHIITGDSVSGIKGINGVGALYASTLNDPQFGTLPISAGGTGASTALSARMNLDVYSKGQVIKLIEGVEFQTLTPTLLAADWEQVGDNLWRNIVALELTLDGGDLIIATPIIENIYYPDQYKDQYWTNIRAMETSDNILVAYYMGSASPTFDIPFNLKCTYSS